MATPSIKYPSGGDFLLHCESPQRSFLSAPVENGNATAKPLKKVAGMPVVVDSLTTPTKATLIEVGQGGRNYDDVNGFIVFGPRQSSIAGTSSTAEKYTIVVMDAVLNEDAIPTRDVYGTKIVIATLKAGTTVAARIADGGFKFVDESEQIRTQNEDPTDPS